MELIPIEEKGTLRNNEFKAAVSRLGIKESNLVFLNQSESNIDTKLLEKTAIGFENKFGSVTHITHSYKKDIHPQHLKSGEIIYNLYTSGLIKDCRFFERRSLLRSTSTESEIESIADTASEKEKVINACNEYKLDKGDMIREGIGFKSVESLFSNLTSNPNVPSYLHGPM